MKAGFIGYRNFAEKLRVLFEQSGRVWDFLFFHPEKTIKGLPCTTKLEELYNRDFIVVASPDRTHGAYLRQLRGYKGHVFCEKIPVLNREDMSFLRRENNPRLYFNFNLRRSSLKALLDELEGEILYINHRMGNGLALREDYKKNWRSDAKRAPLGVFQLSGIHFFDLLVFCFGSPASSHYSARNVSPWGDSIDNFCMSLEFRNHVSSNLFFSYTSPFQYSVEIVTANALLESNGKEVIVRGPRETFDPKGLFATPPVISRKKSNLYEESLENSVQYFLDVVEAGGNFNETLSENNLLSTELFLDILDDID